MRELEDEAISWIAKLTSGNLSQKQLREFQRWRQQSPSHEEALMKMRTLWIHLGNADTLQDRLVLPERTPQPLSHSGHKNNYRTWVISSAMLLLTLCSYYYWTQMRFDQKTAVGEENALSLEDGSRVLLDTASAINIRYTPQARNIELARGQAYFDVVSNASRPFYVKTDGGVIRVLGTAFAVRKESDGVQVTVERGHVQVTNDAQEQVDLLNGEQAQFSPNTMVRTQNASTGSALSWTQGSLQFSNARLSDILKEVQRYDKRTWFTVGDIQEIMDEKFTVIIQLDAISEWLDSLQSITALNMRQYGPIVIVTRKRS